MPTTAVVNMLTITTAVLMTARKVEVITTTIETAVITTPTKVVTMTTAEN